MCPRSHHTFHTWAPPSAARLQSSCVALSMSFLIRHRAETHNAALQKGTHFPQRATGAYSSSSTVLSVEMFNNWILTKALCCRWFHYPSAPPLRGFPGGTSGKEPACPCRRLKRPRFDSWEEGMATHSSVLAWEISCTVNPKGNQPWIFIGRSDAEVPILWSPDVKSWFNRKDPDAGKDWR